MNQPDLLNIKNLSVKCGDNILINHVSLTLQEGRILAIIGESGSGKSLFAKAIMGLLPNGIDRCGEIFFQNRPLFSQLNTLRGSTITLMTQDAMNAFNPIFPLGKQLIETLQIHGKGNKRQCRDKIISTMESVLLQPAQDYLKRYPHQLSGGQLQRVMLALNLALAPKLLIADEPTSALDALTQYELIPLFKRLVRQQTTLIFITHDLALAKEIADEIAIFKQGKLIEHRPKALLFNSPQHTYTQYLLAMRERINQPFERIMR